MAKKIATVHRRKGGVTVKSVEPDSMAFECGIEPGDVVYSINGNVIPDSLSYSYNIAFPTLDLEIQKQDGEVWAIEVENDPDASFGVALEEDPIMLCRNKCIFCFVDQNPKGYRKSLLIKDEDIRLSFMYGNYSTLSSTDAAEEQRIIREMISPLYVSVHATDPETRIFMLKSKKAGNIVERLKRFTDGGIEFHAQIVLCPDVNDGEILEKTFTDLANLYPGCVSIAVVPLGITKHRQGLVKLKPVSDQYCIDTIEVCTRWREKFQKELGYPLIFLGDEFYIRAKQPIPEADHYQDFPQMENGIGMVRRFMDSFDELLPEVNIPEGASGTLVTGSLFGDVLKDCIEKLNREKGTRFQVAAIRNDAFGADLINVAGLVHGVDTIAQLKEFDTLGDFVLLPHVMLKDPEDDPMTIDDYRPVQLSKALKVPIVGSGNTAEELLEVLTNWTDHVMSAKGCGGSFSLAV